MDKELNGIEIKPRQWERAGRRKQFGIGRIGPEHLLFERQHWTLLGGARPITKKL